MAIDTTNVNSGGKSIKIYGTIGSGGLLFRTSSFNLWGVAGQEFSRPVGKDVKPRDVSAGRFTDLMA